MLSVMISQTKFARTCVEFMFNPLIITVSFMTSQR